MSPKLSGQFATVLEADEHIDQLVVWDQLMNWFPQALWKEENTPLAAALPDVDSIQDPFLSTAFALSAVEELALPSAPTRCAGSPRRWRRPC